MIKLDIKNKKVKDIITACLCLVIVIAGIKIFRDFKKMKESSDKVSLKNFKYIFSKTTASSRKV